MHQQQPERFLSALPNLDSARVGGGYEGHDTVLADAHVAAAARTGPPAGQYLVGAHSAAAAATAEDALNERSFRSNLRELQHKMAQLAQENFVLKLANKELKDMLDNLQLDPEHSMRRATEDTFYQFDDDAAKGGGGGGGGDRVGQYSSRDFVEMRAHYQRELAKLQGEKEAAIDRFAEVEHRAASTICEKDFDLENALSENISLRAQLASQREDHESSAALAIKDVELKLTQEVSSLQHDLEAERAAKQEVSLRLLQCEADLEATRDHSSKRSREQSGVLRAVIAEQAAAIRKLESRLDSELSTRALERQAIARQFDDLPRGLSQPGFELYEKLVHRADGTSVLGGAKAWRETVLNELNDSLRTLYSMAKQLEQDRAVFVEKHYRPLLARHHEIQLQISNLHGQVRAL